MPQSNVEVARRGFEAVMCGDLDAIGELLDPEVKWHGGDSSAEGACRNREEALAFMRRARSRNPMGELVDVIDAGDRVVVVIRPARGAELRANLTTFRDGKVIEIVATRPPTTPWQRPGYRPPAELRVLQGHPNNLRWS
jgi:ketosteroid isomerase-like protein